MNTTRNLLLSDVHQTLLNTIERAGGNTLEAAFLAWIYPPLNNSLNARLPEDWSAMDYRHVAQLGFLSQGDSDTLLRQKDNLLDGLKRLVGRPIKVTGGYRAPFTTDVVALIGLALGARILGGDIQLSVTSWMMNFAQETCKDLPLWKRCLGFSALQLLDPEMDISLSINGDAADIRVALTQVGIQRLLQADDNKLALSSLFKETIEDVDKDPCLAGIRYTALKYVIESLPTLSLNKPTIIELITFLERIPAAFRRWTWEEKAKTSTSTVQMWDVQNEYHVQNLLYLLLSPIFPDLEDEFYLDPVGQKNARADLGIPSMKLIIEVKFLRSNVRFADMVEEIAADNSLYFGTNSEYNTRYQHLIAFVWDDSRRDTEHDVFKRGVNQFNHVVGSVIISRPGIMPHRKS